MRGKDGDTGLVDESDRLNPTCTGKRHSHGRRRSFTSGSTLSMRRKDFLARFYACEMPEIRSLFPCGVSRRCPPTATFAPKMGARVLMTTSAGNTSVYQALPLPEASTSSSVASDRRAGRVYSLSAYQVNMGVLIPFCWVFLLCLGLGRWQEISSSINTQTKGCTLNLKCGSIFSVRI